jgi:GntR family transcriptional regulator
MRAVLDNRSLAQQARDALLEAIRSGAFPDDRLPPESELSAQLGVSRTTLRAALQSLAADGLISRRRRHGTYVNAHLLRASMRLNRLVPFTRLIEQCGHEPSVDPQTVSVAVPPAAARDALGVKPDTPCVVVERLLRAGGRPVITVLDVVPVARLAVAPEAVQAADTTFDFLARNGVDPVEYAVSEIIPRVAAVDDLPAGLEIEPGVPYIELLETHFSSGHECVAISRIAVDDRLVRFSLLRRDL